jgi:hypothetical protein
VSPLSVDRLSNGLRVANPIVVLEANGVQQLASNVVLANDALTYNMKGIQRGGYLSSDPEPYNIAPDGNSMTIRMNDGLVYTVRRVTEDDGRWASKIVAPAPIDSIEKLALGGTYMAPGVFNSNDEDIFAALGADDELVHELVYSSPAGTYIRSSWFKVPDDDDHLDGLESIDVNGRFVDAFDAAEQAGQAIPRTDVLQYAGPESTLAPAEAG